MTKLSSIIIVSGLIFASCNNSSNNANTAMTDSTAVDTTAVVIEEVAYVLPPVEENKVGGVHMNKKHHAYKKAGKPTDDVDAEDDFETVELDVYVAALADSGIVPLTPTAPAVKPDSITTTTTATELSDDQTVVELGKKGQASMMQVYSDPADPNTIDKIVFTDKKHVDIYNVQAGMSARDVRKLRKDMKHMVKDGKVFMYEDDSNIMYQMTTTDNTTKTSYTASEVDDMSVDAIVWKNNSDKKKVKKS